MKLKIAFLQLLPVGSLKGNMEKGIKACFQAKEKGADIAIFPEMWSCGYIFPREEAILRECVVPCYGSFVKRFAELAAELDMAIAITFWSNMSRNREIRFVFSTDMAKCGIVIQKSIFAILGKKMMKVFWMREMISL